MQLSSVPSKFLKIFAQGAAPGNIRTVPVTSSDPNAASQNLGWPPATMTPSGAGGVPPDGRDMNGLNYMLSAWAQWQAAGGVVQYDSAFQTAIGGYPQWAIVGSLTHPGNYWQSTADNNTTNPDASGAGWQAWPPASSFNPASPPPIGNVTPNQGFFSNVTSYGPIFAVASAINGADLQISGVGFSQSFGASGYQRLPSGLLMQWGHLNTPTGNGDTITFPLSFPNNCAIAMDVGNDNSGAVFVVNGSLSGPPYSSVKVWSFKSGTPQVCGISYIALGN